MSGLVELSVLGVSAVVAPHLRLTQSGHLQLSLQTDLSRLGYRLLLCMEATYPYPIKNQLGALGAFMGYGIRELAQPH